MLAQEIGEERGALYLDLEGRLRSGTRLSKLSIPDDNYGFATDK
jgi:hypothetical protein